MLIDHKAVAGNGLVELATRRYREVGLARQALSAKFTGHFRRELYVESGIGTDVRQDELVEKETWLQLIVPIMDAA